LAVRPVDAGRRGQCLKCGRQFHVGADAPLQTAPESQRAAKPPATLTFSCELCATRLTVRAEEVGRAVKCPDCGRRNVVPPPEIAAVAKTPSAMSGDQYELWDVDDSPMPAELAERSPRLHPVHCGLCQTLMYATDAQVGKKLKCPDCGALTVATPRAPVAPRGPVLVPDGEEYQLDPASAPTPRPVPLPAAVREAERHAEAQVDQGARVRPAANDRRTGATVAPPTAAKAREAVRQDDRPVRPAVPLVQGVLAMLLSGDILVRWVALSVGLTMVQWLLMQVALAMGGGFAAISALSFFAAGCVMAAAWLTAALPLFIAIVAESSEGNDRLQEPPHWTSFDWFGEVSFFAIAAAFSALPAWLSTKLALGLTLEGQIAVATGAFLVVFPIVLLSALEQGSPLDVLSPRVLASLGRCAGPWLLFYLESAALGAVVVAAAWAVLTEKPALVLLLPWLVVGAAIVYMRLIGRLAWWIAEVMPPVEPASEPS
jgi:DNA-directed RNA polymerase subunit RPC12/RpoP